MADESKRAVIAGDSQVVSGQGGVAVNPAAMMQGTSEEIARLLAPGQVVGDPMVFGETTIIPLVSIGFGFGAGGGGGAGSKDQDEGQGGGGGGGGGGGIRPIAVIIIDKEGTRLAPIPDSPSGLDRLGSAIGAALEKRSESSSG